MKTAIPGGGSVVQIAYHVPDVEIAARQFADLFGWGPFFVAHNIELESCTYRGKPAHLDHSAACGQAGPIMVELNHQNGEYPSFFRDMYAANEFGVTHQASFAPDFEDELQRYDALRFPAAMRAVTKSGIEYAMVDTRPLLGYMTELYRPCAELYEIYATVREAAVNWDGRDPVRRL